ncbi:hypothetical protein BH23ACT9_BH23ACT9_08100 [soil metagenome]
MGQRAAEQAFWRGVRTRPSGLAEARTRYRDWDGTMRFVQASASRPLSRHVPYDERAVPRRTVEDVFTGLEHSITQDGAYVDGGYDAQTGLPVDIRVDAPQSVDEEYGLRLRLVS